MPVVDQVADDVQHQSAELLGQILVASGCVRRQSRVEDAQQVTAPGQDAQPTARLQRPVPHVQHVAAVALPHAQHRPVQSANESSIIGRIAHPPLPTELSKDSLLQRFDTVFLSQQDSAQKFPSTISKTLKIISGDLNASRKLCNQLWPA